MSVINKMLRDLDSRQAQDAVALPSGATHHGAMRGTTTVLAPEPGTDRRRYLAWFGMLALLVGAIVLVQWLGSGPVVGPTPALSADRPAGAAAQPAAPAPVPVTVATTGLVAVPNPEPAPEPARPPAAAAGLPAVQPAARLGAVGATTGAATALRAPDPTAVALTGASSAPTVLALPAAARGPDQSIPIGAAPGPALPAAAAPAVGLPAAAAAAAETGATRGPSAAVVPAGTPVGPVMALRPGAAAATPVAAPQRGAAQAASVEAGEAGAAARPNPTQATLAQAQGLWNAGARQGAIDLLREAVATVVRSDQAGASVAAATPALVRELARMELAQGQVAEALERLIRLEPLLAGQADLWAVRGNAAQRLGRHAESASAYQAALRLRPDEPRWMLGLAVSLAADGQTAAAAQWAERAREAAPVSPELLAYLRQMGVNLRER